MVLWVQMERKKKKKKTNFSDGLSVSDDTSRTADVIYNSGNGGFAKDSNLYITSVHYVRYFAFQG